MPMNLGPLSSEGARKVGRASTSASSRSVSALTRRRSNTCGSAPNCLLKSAPDASAFRRTRRSVSSRRSAARLPMSGWACRARMTSPRRVGQTALRRSHGSSELPRHPLNTSNPLSPRSAGGDAAGRGGGCSPDAPPSLCLAKWGSPPLSLRDISPRSAGGELFRAFLAARVGISQRAPAGDEEWDAVGQWDFPGERAGEIAVEEHWALID